MNDFNPKQGEMILAKKHSSNNGDWEAVEFGVKLDGVYHCRGERGWLLSPFNYAKPSPSKSEPIPFTQETWPKQVVWLRTETNKAEGSEQVVCVHQDGVSTLNCFISYSTLGIENQMSLDFGKTWQPCHYTPTE